MFSDWEDEIWHFRKHEIFTIMELGRFRDHARALVIWRSGDGSVTAQTARLSLLVRPELGVNV